MAKKTENEVKETKKEAAVMDGANRFQIMTKVIMPLIQPGIVTAEVKRSVSLGQKEKEHVGIPGDQRLLCGHAVRSRAV